MSTILDALRKSEQERKRNHVPTLSDMPLPQEKSNWPLITIAVLSLVLALVLGVLVSQWFFAKPSHPSNESSVLGLASNPTPGSTPATQSEQAISQVNLQDIIVNVISYSDQPSARFVMLNGKMFRENDFVRAGLKVEEIQQNAVVFNHRGERVSRTP